MDKTQPQIFSHYLMNINQDGEKILPLFFLSYNKVLVPLNINGITTRYLYYWLHITSIVGIVLTKALHVTQSIPTPPTYTDQAATPMASPTPALPGHLPPSALTADLLVTCQASLYHVTIAPTHLRNVLNPACSSAHIPLTTITNRKLALTV